MYDDIRPKRKDRVYDSVEAAGVDVTDWEQSSADPRRKRMNPKYCYNWSFVQPGKVVVASLWHAEMQPRGATVIHAKNFREDARLNAPKQAWRKRATDLDEALHLAHSHGIPVRVIILDGGRMRQSGNPRSQASRPERRQLDNREWRVEHYDEKTGDHILIRT